MLKYKSNRQSSFFNYHKHFELYFFRRQKQFQGKVRNISLSDGREVKLYSQSVCDILDHVLVKDIFTINHPVVFGRVHFQGYRYTR